MAAAVLVLPTVSAQAGEPPRVPVTGPDRGPGTMLGTATDAGPTDPAEAVVARVFLSGDTNGLSAYAQAVSDPGNRLYGHYLTPVQARARFGGTQQQTTRVSAWLRESGLTIDTVTAHSITVHGTAAQAGAAFGTHLENYELFGGRFHGPATDITAPAAVAPDVLSVTGLLTFPRGKGGKPARAATAVKTAENPCPAYFGQRPATELPPAYGHSAQWAPCGYTPKQVRDAYGVTSTGLTGKGVTIGIIGVGNEVNALADTNRFARDHGEPELAPGQFIPYIPADARPEQASGEFTMDIQAAHAMAPDAKIAYVVAPGHDTGVDTVVDAITDIVDKHLADVVSGSIGVGGLPGTPDAATIAAYERMFQLAAVEGISVNFASGDSGGELYDDVLHTDYPPSSPWVTAVGGTTLALGPDNSYMWETGWATDYVELSEDGTQWSAQLPGYQGKASGGGTSSTFPQPFYQRGVVPPSRSGTPPMRTVPDISALADPALGMLIGETEYDRQGNLTYSVSMGGGTSLSSPLLAGIEALMVQTHHGPIGFINPALYSHKLMDFHQIHDNPANTPTTIAFAWVQHGYVELVTPGQYTDSNLTFNPGYNTVTGLGSPTRELIESFRRHY
ncbi:S53 family peptidase [Actinocrispum sp. NPDC049592]|uniref:S53 family peptidase n=1 Tax=Actinocrispum sp. NPDC049592 TaxID=3154835 RepID=UPI0034147A53